MSTLPIGPDSHAKAYFFERLQKLLNFDEVRIMELLESFQYGILYILVCFFLGVTLDYAFPKYDEKKSSQEIFLEVVLQCLALIIFVFYGRKLVKILPFLFFFKKPLFGSTVPKYRAYESTEYEGEVVIGFILVATQTNLLKKLDHISKQLYTFLFQEKRDAVEAVKKEEVIIKQEVQKDEKALEKDFRAVERDVKAIEQAL